MSEQELIDKIRPYIVDENLDPVENLIDTLVDLLVLDVNIYNALIENVAEIALSLHATTNASSGVMK